MMKRNLCDNCKDCEDNDESILYCIDKCAVPIDILNDVEKERNNRTIKCKEGSIKLVIEIDEEIYEQAITSGYSHLYDEEVARAVSNGTPLEEYCKSQNYCQDYIFATESEDDE